MSQHDDAGWMRRALELGSRSTRAVRPNPRVGCVLMRDGVEVGAGWHARAGGPHAEAAALQVAGERARGATCYVTLEPCAHFGRTPPCAQALIAAGVSRVVIATRDPNPQAAGGVALLRAAGIEVATGVEEAAARALAEVFLTEVEAGRPFVQCKLAMSLDGRIAAADGTSRWITGVEARRLVHTWRAEAEAVLVGSGTALADDPRLDVRDLAEGASALLPLRVVLDRRLRLSTASHLADTSRQPTVAFVADAALQAGARAAALRARGVDVACVQPDAGADDSGAGWLREVLRELGRRGVHHVLCEAGPQLSAALVRANLVDRLDLIVAPKLLGAGTPVMGDLGIPTLAAALQLRLDGVARLDGDAWLTLRPQRHGTGRMPA